MMAHKQLNLLSVAHATTTQDKCPYRTTGSADSFEAAAVGGKSGISRVECLVWDFRTLVEFQDRGSPNSRLRLTGCNCGL